MKRRKGKVFGTYVDRRADDGLAFYAGKGNDDRLRGTERNLRHRNTVKKHGLEREVVMLTSIEDLAYAHEVELIAELHTFVDDPLYNGIGCNYTPGGRGHRHAKVTKDKESKTAVERWADPEERKRQSVRMKGKNTGKKHTPQQNAAHSKRMSGAGNPNFGKSPSASTRAKWSAQRKGKPSWKRGTKGTAGALAYGKLKFIPLTVTMVDGQVHEFASHKHAAEFLGKMFGYSPHTVKVQLVKRVPEFCGVKLMYKEKT